MTFENVNILWGLWVFPVLLGLFLIFAKRRARKLQTLFGSALAERVPQYSKWGRVLQCLWLILALLCFGVALMRPYTDFETLTLERKGVDLYFLVDVSPSMLAQDLKPSRIERARYKIFDFLKILKGDRVGLIAFSGQAFVLTPLTADYETLQIFADELKPELFPNPGTNIRDAVKKAVDSMSKLSQTSSRALVVFTDGEDSLGLDDAAIAEIKRLNIQLYVVGIGTVEGAPIPLLEGGYKTDASGKLVLTRLDESALKKLAVATGGGYVRLAADDDDVLQIYEEGIQKSFADTKFAEEQKKMPHYVFPFFMALGLLFLTLEHLTTHTRRFWWRKLLWKKN